MWTLSAITVFTHFCLRSTKDKERFEARFIFRIFKKTINLYVQKILCGHFSQNILVSYVRPCFKWLSGNAFFIRFQIRTKNRRHVFKRWRFRQQLLFKWLSNICQLPCWNFLKYAKPTYEECLRTFIRQEDRHSSHILTEHPQRLQSYVSEPETPKYLKHRALQKYHVRYSESN